MNIRSFAVLRIGILGAALAVGACHGNGTGTVSGTGVSGASNGGTTGSPGSGGTTGGPGSGGTAGSPGTTTAYATFTPTAIGLEAGDVSNSLRGQYIWYDHPGYPSGWKDVDVYWRWTWAQIEPSQGHYNWKPIDDEIAKAKSQHGRFGMRIAALCSGCTAGNHTYSGAQSAIPDDLAAVCNPLIASAPGDSTKYLIPDWNSKAYLDRLEELVQAIATRYRNDPTFAFVDIFSYGNWGEWHLYPFSLPGGPYDHSIQRPLTDANAKLIVDRAAAAFNNKLLVINPGNPAALAEAVAIHSPPIGIRDDCLGSDQLAGGEPDIAAVPGASDLWKRAPFITEWCAYNLGSSGADLFVQGEQQVRDFHVSMLSSGNYQANPSAGIEIDAFRKANAEAGYRLRVANVSLQVSESGSIRIQSQWVNDGVAPTYIDWRVVLGLRGAKQTMEVPLSLDLRSVLPGSPRDDDETLVTGSPIADGSYAVYLRVEDAQGVSLPMQLAMDGRNTMGEYALGTIDMP